MKRIYLCILTCLCVCFANAQISHYECDFDDATERSEWTLNLLSDWRNYVYNEWQIGQAGQFGPNEAHKYGLFITSDTALAGAGRAIYEKKPKVRIGTARNGYDVDGGIIATASRELWLEAGTYLLSFDWIGNCKGSSQDGLYVAVVDTSYLTYSGNCVSGLRDYFNPNNSVWRLYNAISPKVHHYEQYWWNVDNIIFTTDGTPKKLVFVWYNDAGSSEAGKLMPAPPSACIDNIVIDQMHTHLAGNKVRVDTCMIPTNITRICNPGRTVTFSWHGESDYYDIKLFNPTDSTWQLIPNVKDTFYTLSNYSEGVQCFYVQGHCIVDGKDYASGYALWRRLLWYAGERCIDYMDLTDDKCWWGSAVNPHMYNQAVDLGFENDTSRHSLHFMPNEYDTLAIDIEQDMQLLTKPVDALTSVRLGNPLNGMQQNNMGGEQVEYTYTVEDESNSILCLQYAVVLQNKIEHSEKVQSHFRLEILHGNAVENEECDVVDFAAGFAEDAESGYWHHYFQKYDTQDSDHQSEEQEVHIWWRDWDALYVNLKDYIGETIKIRLTTNDCTDGGHFGYAYFVINCTSGDFAGNSCNSDKPNINTFTAPEGFFYRWYRKDDAEIPVEDREILSDSIAFDVNFLDPNVYCVDLISLLKPNCYHTYEVCGLPQVPTANIEWEQVRMCENSIMLKDISTLTRMMGDSVVPLMPGDKLYSCKVDYGDGSPVEEILGKDSVFHEFPESGVYQVEVTASASDIPECPNENVITIPIEVSLKEVGPFYISVGDNVAGYEYWGTFDVADTTYVQQTQPDEENCEYDVDVHVYEKYFPVDTTICEGTSITFIDPISGISYTKSEPSGSEPYQLAFKKHENHCEALDSILVLTLHQITLPAIKINDTIQVCADAFSALLDCSLIKGEEALKDITIRMSKGAQDAGFDAVYSFTKEELLDNAMNLPLPNGVKPGYYWIEIDMSTETCDVMPLKVCLQINYPSSLVNEILGGENGFLSVVYSDRFGDEFIGYAWYRNGSLIYEGTESYVAITRANDFGSTYQVVLTRDDGSTLPACEYVIGGGTKLDVNKENLITINPTLVPAGDKLFLSHAADVKIYTILGVCVANYSNVESIQAPAYSGIYFIQLNNNQIVKIYVE